MCGSHKKLIVSNKQFYKSQSSVNRVLQTLTHTYTHSESIERAQAENKRMKDDVKATTTTPIIVITTMLLAAIGK